ncbi:MAG: phosphoribosylformylglycinamidine synthase subunit PurL [Bacteroidota bacterium]|nr:phosphoribosylformylglycinamidine synthase subunit PurL [Bacteroidota bacterium]MDP4232349.1 phosphoribosylformylglycinamidine synthase subunit PurL [Bacteroidota bacterium]MDP4241488.1 phosphoribosylformylglycinamidine synthase subunit PurL [Bacteroidota bacterium]MDP4289015.1 phosphoribosylformylglycinamidine synthase subunit PurL [Bacteroidota bacterium]
MQPPITSLEQAERIAIELGLLKEEFAEIVSILGGRVPTYTELGIFSVMWSEHCSYKNSIAQLKTLPRKGGRLLVEAGEENAGLVDIGDGLAVAFKIESHNHPSAVVPYEGAATGVGGILRDIFTMGARPIAALNSLRFGELTGELSDRTKFLLRGVVHGISDYGNSFGVPTVAGEVYFDKCYQGNPLVNAMAVGIVEHGKTVSASAEGIGNLVMLVGSRTGRDGIHGASLLASAVFSEAAESLRPTVQVGDPFAEKLLLEATLEAIAAGVVVGMQDMGAAGISCCTSEMSAKAGTGMMIDLNRVPLRETGMSAFEIMLSESQERMLVVVEPEDVAATKAIFDKWDLQAEIIGTVTDTGNVVIDYLGERVADIPAKALALGGDMTPVYYRDSHEPKYLTETRKFDPIQLSDVEDAGAVLRTLLGVPSIASKRWIYEQYDSMVRTNSLYLTGSDAAIVRVKGTTKGLAMKTDCNSRYVRLDPYRGTVTAVVEAARNIACTGATPIGVTNCLNFGNPYDPEVYWQFKEAIRGMGDACRVLGTPVTGGNVSFYNESPEGAIFPTPTIGMIGLIEDITKVVSSDFKHEGDAIILLSVAGSKNISDGLGGSEYLYQRTGLVTGAGPDCDVAQEAELIRSLIELSEASLIHSAHDISEGGFAVALAECCFAQGTEQPLGAKIGNPHEGTVRRDAILFAERQGRVILSADPENVAAIQAIATKHSLRASQIGTVQGDRLVIGEIIDEAILDLFEIYSNALPSLMDKEVAVA